MVCHVVEVNGDGLLVEKLDTLDTDLGVLRLMLLFLLRLCVVDYRFLVFRLDSCAVNAGSLVRLIDLCCDDLIQANHRCFFMTLTKLCELFDLLIALNSYFDGLEKP